MKSLRAKLHKGRPRVVRLLNLEMCPRKTTRGSMLWITSNSNLPTIIAIRIGMISSNPPIKIKEKLNRLRRRARRLSNLISM